MLDHEAGEHKSQYSTDNLKILNGRRRAEQINNFHFQMFIFSNIETNAQQSHPDHAQQCQLLSANRHLMEPITANNQNHDGNNLNRKTYNADKIGDAFQYVSNLIHNADGFAKTIHNIRPPFFCR
jgi:hypothetical protein